MLVASSLVTFSGVASAGGSAAAFAPIDPFNASIIASNGYYVWNTSVAYAALVIADLGVGGPASKSVIVYGYGSGGGDLCFITASALNSTARFVDKVSSSNSTGPYQLSVTFSTALPPGDNYSYQLECSLGAFNSSFPTGEQLWGYQTE